MHTRQESLPKGVRHTMRVRFLAIALGSLIGTCGPAAAQRWSPRDNPNHWTFIDRTARVYDGDTEQSPAEGRLFVTTTDANGNEMPPQGDYHGWSALLVFDRAQRSRDGQSYWQRGFTGSAYCGHSQIAVDQLDLLDKDGTVLVDNFIGNTSKSFAISDKDESSRIYHFVCKS